MNISAIVAAAGQGLRLQSALKQSVPKPYLMVGGAPLVVHSLRALADTPQVKEIIIAVEPGYRLRMRRDVVERYGIKKVAAIVSGGATRTDSVKRGFKKVSPSASHVLIHDAARPLLAPAAVRALIHTLDHCDGAVLAAPVAATLKKVLPAQVIDSTVSRESLWEAETPQLFTKQILQAAYRAYGRSPFPATDEASLVEHVGGRIKVCASPLPNPKMTTVKDYHLITQLLRPPATPVRCGWGTDTHRLVTGRPLMLGGVRVPFSKGPQGHSDGDPVLHALADGILGAIGQGDIGEYFPDTAPRLKNISSARIVTHAVNQARTQGYRVQQVDVVIVLERPKLGMFKKKIQQRIAHLLRINASLVNIKAKTNEGLGPEGEGRAVTAQALVVLASAPLEP